MKGSARFVLLAILQGAYAQDLSLVAWNAYTNWIKTYLTLGQPITAGVDQIFFNPPGTLVVAGGSPVPDALTNVGIYGMADVLQNPDSPYMAVNGPSYIEGLHDYLVNTKRPSPATAAQQAQLAVYTQAVADASVKARAEKLAAYNAFLTDPFPKPPGQTFELWAYDNYPTYILARDAQTAALATAAAYSREINDADAQQILEKIKTLEEKGLSATPIPGYTMPMYFGNNPFPLTPFKKNEITDNTTLVYKPLYQMTGYEEACDAWLQKSTAQSTFTLTASSSSSYEWKSSGYTSTVTRSKDGLFWGLFGSKSSTSTTYSEFSLGDRTTTTSTVTMTLRMKGAPLVFSLKAGLWDSPGVRTAYPNLIPGRVNPFASATRVEKVLIGYNVGMSITISDDATFLAAQAFINGGKSQAGGSLSIFGFKFGSKSSSTDYSRSFSDISFTKNTQGGSINLASTPDGVAILMGGYGRRL